MVAAPQVAVPALAGRLLAVACDGPARTSGHQAVPLAVAALLVGPDSPARQPCPFWCIPPGPALESTAGAQWPGYALDLAEQER